mmetsp:Transcript_40003/g.113111  ORF Transcript_40003/g.113111 Transcript_40003/m.113111 type:complete len:288 (+) Transcript_40003:339-1202(+)
MPEGGLRRIPGALPRPRGAAAPRREYPWLGRWVGPRVRSHSPRGHEGTARGAHPRRAGTTASAGGGARGVRLGGARGRGEEEAGRRRGTPGAVRAQPAHPVRAAGVGARSRGRDAPLRPGRLRPHRRGDGRARRGQRPGPAAVPGRSAPARPPRGRAEVVALRVQLPAGLGPVQACEGRPSPRLLQAGAAGRPAAPAPALRHRPRRRAPAQQRGGGLHRHTGSPVRSRRHAGHRARWRRRQQPRCAGPRARGAVRQWRRGGELAGTCDPGPGRRCAAMRRDGLRALI